jgi:hypothetical protein
LAKKQKAPARPKRRNARAIRVPIKKAGKISHRDVHTAIQKHLAATEETDLFCNDEILIIVVEKHGN